MKFHCHSSHTKDVSESYCDRLPLVRRHLDLLWRSFFQCTDRSKGFKHLSHSPIHSNTDVRGCPASQEQPGVASILQRAAGRSNWRPFRLLDVPLYILSYSRQSCELKTKLISPLTSFIPIICGAGLYAAAGGLFTA